MPLACASAMFDILFSPPQLFALGKGSELGSLESPGSTHPLLPLNLVACEQSRPAGVLLFPLTVPLYLPLLLQQCT